MNKNLIIGLLLLVVVIESGYLLWGRNSSYRGMMQTASGASGTMPAAGPNARGGRQMMLTKGQVLKNSPIFQYAYQLVPGPIPDATKKAMTGFSVQEAAQPDGSTLVTLMPKDSEDQKQEYTVKKGQMLYFIEQTPADDQADKDLDLNYRDDYGIITDGNGIVQ